MNLFAAFGPSASLGLALLPAGLSAALLPCMLCADEMHRPPVEVIEAVRRRFDPIQHLSFAANLEYCGYVGRDVNGEIAFTPMLRGDADGCTPPIPDPTLTVFASMHTHGAYHPDVPAEFPTALDMQSDRNEGVNGFVATPGGRLWYIDSAAMITFQLCGLGCLPQDPTFRAGDDGTIAQSYTLEQLLQLEGYH
ncbi:DUF4329 domain-containing protein [Lutimaribacter marinistellae]|uniref:DUF4329 domain-containing protein n=1 Tax=Lutimaribacter marinistellae TaxID=1820329 RepID=A0ABV7TET4_9RHOB